MEDGRAGRASTSLYATLAAAGVLVALLPLSPALKRRFLANHQLRPPSTASWIAIGMLPKMYGGSHQMWISPEPVSDFFAAHPERAPFPIAHYWVNHSPGRAVRLDSARESAAHAGVASFVRLESSYGDESLLTIYRVRAIDGRIEVRDRP